MSDRLEAFRALVYDGVAKALAEDGYCKSYEGSIAYNVTCPCYFAREQPVHHHLELHCYVLGPQRHYTWHATSVDELFDAAERDLRKWIAELVEAESDLMEGP